MSSVMWQRAVVPALALFLVLPAGATPVDDRDGALVAADRLLDVQFANGAFPWIVGSPGVYQNVQGITAIALLEAYKLSLDDAYLSGAQGTRDWLAAYLAADPVRFLSSANIYFVAEYALVTLDTADFELAQDEFDRALLRYGSPEGIVDSILTARVNQGHTNLGLWDVALWIRAAQDIGWEQVADDMSAQVLAQTIVDPFDSTANWYELGLSGLLFGLAESDLVGNLGTLDAAKAALLASQCESGAFPVTWQGEVYCDDVQTTAYAVIGLLEVFEVVAAHAGCDFLRATQTSADNTTFGGGWDLGGYEIAEVDAEAAGALAQCAAPTTNGVLAYADDLRAVF